MKTTTVVRAFQRQISPEPSVVAPRIHRLAELNWHRINLHRVTHLEPSALASSKASPPAPSCDANHQAVPDSLEEWLANRQTLKIGSSLPATGSKAVAHA
jgi:hypothetical protein